MGAGQFRYRPTGSPWAFAGVAGIAANGSGFTAGNPPAPEGTQVAFLQKTGSFSQAVAGWAAGSYRLTFHAAQRGNFGTSRQDFRVLVDGVAVGTFTPSGTSYQVLTTAALHGHGRVAHDRVPGLEQRRRRQHRLHRSDFRCRGLGVPTCPSVRPGWKFLAHVGFLVGIRGAGRLAPPVRSGIWAGGVAVPAGRLLTPTS